MPLSPVVEEEIKRMQEMIDGLERGEVEQDDFQRFRLENGIYGIRNEPDLHMVRVKVRFGNITGDQLEALGEFAERFTPNKLGHVTTRQDIQFHLVKRRDIPECMRFLNSIGLTTREACGNTVRNVTSCPYAGLSPDEPFDVTPYADIVSAYFLRNPLNQNLPRKFKIAFEGCREDHARIGIHDLGLVAKVKMENGRKIQGFELHVGGGLGAVPKSAKLLDEFVPMDLLFASCEAVIRLHDRHSNRENKNKARIKFIVDQWGIEEFRRKFLAERKSALLTRSGYTPDFVQYKEEEPPYVEAENLKPYAGWVSTPDYERWLMTNVWRQKQKGYAVVHIRCPLGDITPDQFRAMGRLARQFCGGRARTAISQNILFRWVPEAALPRLYQELERAELANTEAERVADITRCPGADTCKLAITHSRALATEASKIFLNGYTHVPELQDIKIKISGCFNSCGQHHIATIGFYGASEKIHGREAPVYVMMIGGYTEEGKAVFGDPVCKLPARRIPDAVKQVFDMYLEGKQNGESFLNWVKRYGHRNIRQALFPLKDVPPPDAAPEFYMDLGEDKPFMVEIGEGECAK